MMQNSAPACVFAVAAPFIPMSPFPANVNDVIAFVPEIFDTGPGIGCAPATEATVENEAPVGRSGLLKLGVHTSDVGLQIHCAPVRMLTHGETTTLFKMQGTFEIGDPPGPEEPNPPGSCT